MLSRDVEVDGKAYKGSANYECTFLGFANDGTSTIYDVKGEALVVSLDSGRALVAPILGDGFCNLDRSDPWNWNKEFGKLSARFAVKAAISENRKVALDSIFRPGILIVLDNRENPKTFQFLDWRVPEVALKAPAHLKELSVTATRGSATTGIRQRLPWLAEKTP